MGSRDSYAGLSWIYDALAHLVFGGTLKKAQTIFLDKIPKGANVLVLGGGTGRWLRHPAIHKATPSITYVDSSKAMVRRAMIHAQNTKTIFFECKFEDFAPPNDFDVVITYCFLDLFSDRDLGEIVRKVKASLKPDATWLVVDFQERTWWHRFMLRIMYMFFYWTTDLRTRKLPQWHALLVKEGLHPDRQRTFFGHFISASAWRIR